MQSEQKEKSCISKSQIMAFICVAALILITVGAFAFSVHLWQIGYRTVAQEPFNPQDMFRVELNTADMQALCSLPGIGEKKAEAILKYRTENGPFDSIESLKKVKGISNKNIEEIRAYLYIE